MIQLNKYDAIFESIRTRSIGVDEMQYIRIMMPLCFMTNDSRNTELHQALRSDPEYALALGRSTCTMCHSFETLMVGVPEPEAFCKDHFEEWEAIYGKYFKEWRVF
jgi:hypothetical protein